MEFHLFAYIKINHVFNWKCFFQDFDLIGSILDLTEKSKSSSPLIRKLLNSFCFTLAICIRSARSSPNSAIIEEFINGFASFLLFWNFLVHDSEKYFLLFRKFQKSMKGQKNF